ncbi:MAG: type II secretion system protein GspK [Cystobacterineae bacterium]|nr:type II secretion system protein GspK [Cystobacterineae bacterium]
MKNSRRKKRISPRGVALVIVLVGTTILTVLIQEMAYRSSVELSLATNQRDELKAHYLARSGIQFSRLMLVLQKQVEQIKIPSLAALLGPTANTSQFGGFMPQNLSLQLWRLAKIDCYLTHMLWEPSLDMHQADPVASACFDVKISDEEERLNLNQLDAPNLKTTIAVAQLLALIGDKKYGFIYEPMDMSASPITPTEIIQNIRDWIDENTSTSTLNLSGQGAPFLDGFADENFYYASKYVPHYYAKNARFDSLDELYMVHGVDDRFMTLFRDRLTVFPDMNSRLNINTNDPVLLELAIRSIADPLKPDMRLQDPLFVETLIGYIRQIKVMSGFALSIEDFVGLMQAAGIATNSAVTANMKTQRYLGDTSSTFRIQSVGTSGKTKRTLTAVMRMDREPLGQIVYYREE